VEVWSYDFEVMGAEQQDRTGDQVKNEVDQEVAGPVSELRTT
jgi:hypothetical protein